MLCFYFTFLWMKNLDIDYNQSHARVQLFAPEPEPALIFTPGSEPNRDSYIRTLKI